MAARAPQAAAILTPQQALAFVRRHGIVGEAARHTTIPALVDAIAGEHVRGNWWSHPKSRLIFALTRCVRAAPDVLVCRLAGGKITFIHKRLWPALIGAADRLPRARLARIHETHTKTGRHIVEETPFPEWVPDRLTAASARNQRNRRMPAALQAVLQPAP